MDVKSDWSIQDVLARLTALETRPAVSEPLANLALKVAELEETTALCGPGWAAEIKRRVESLERDAPTWKTFGAALKRIEALEELRRVSDRMWNATVPDLVSRVRALDPEGGWEHDRQARWHAHRLGVLCAAIQHYGWDYLKESESSAIDAADRAHGPLEGKGQEPTQEQTDLFMQGYKTARAELEGRTRADDINDHSDDVNALVKAALVQHQLWVTFQCQEMYGEMLREGMQAEDFEAWDDAQTALNAALKPFSEAT